MFAPKQSQSQSRSGMRLNSAKADNEPSALEYHKMKEFLLKSQLTVVASSS